jgi:DNA-binding MarR family transcriptional regulator
LQVSSQLIDELESAGLGRRRPSATDRRAREIVITPKGRRLLQQARRLIAQVEDEVLAGLTAEDRRELLALLRRALDSAPAQPFWTSKEGD